MPDTAAWVAVTCVRICWFVFMIAAVFAAVVVAWVNVAVSMTGTCALAIVVQPTMADTNASRVARALVEVRMVASYFAFVGAK
jgi:hypothetical protein